MQGIGRAGRSSPFGSRKSCAVVLYNEEDLKSNAVGMTGEMRALLQTSNCLKDKLASNFGYKFHSEVGWCCSNC